MIVDLERAAELILQGEVVAMPTETVYGLAADAMNAEAVKKTFSLKNRPADNPLIVHISDMNQLNDLVRDIPPAARKLAETFWPGPLTLVLNKDNKVPDVVSGGLSTVAVRMPAHPLALELIQKTGPLTAPSANRSGKPSPTRVGHVIEDFGNQIPVLDGGECEIGLESTVLHLANNTWEILRPGAVSKKMLENVLGSAVIENDDKDQQRPASPGIKYSHYKPNAKVIWIEKIPASPDLNTYYLVHSGLKNSNQQNVICYHNDFDRLARELYDQFRTADHLGYSQIAVEILPESDKSPVISPLIDRINRAAGKAKS
jgi:L-threonylcarbamoyladenylate synthase